jgi:hypothetical protein
VLGNRRGDLLLHCYTLLTLYTLTRILSLQ